MMQINKKIQEARELKGWSQQKIADEIGEKRSTYAEWERNTVPDFDIVVKIAAATGMSIMEFVAAVDEKMAGNISSDEKQEHPDAIMISNDKVVLVDAKSLGATYERIIEEKELRRKDAETFAKKMEDHYNDAKQDKEKLFATINEVLRPIKDKTESIESNLNEGVHLLKDQIYIVSRQLAPQGPGAAIRTQSADQTQHVPFAKKGKAERGKQQSGAKKGSSH